MQKTKQWQWMPEDQFQVDGRTIETCINLVQSILQDPSSAKVVWAIEADKLLSQVMNKGIQDGVIKEKSDVEGRIENAEFVKEFPSHLVGENHQKIYNDQNHYKKMSPQEFEVVFGNSFNFKKEKARKENMHKWNLFPSDPVEILDGKYWIPKDELEILNSFSGQEIKLWHSDEGSNEYTLYINTY